MYNSFNDETNEEVFIGIKMQDGYRFVLNSIEFIVGGSTNAQYAEVTGASFEYKNEDTDEWIVFHTI